MARALAEQEPAQSHALTRWTQARGLQHFIDIVPRTAGQSRLPSPWAGHAIDGVIIQNRSLVAHFHVRHRTRCHTTIRVEYKKEIRQMQVFRN
jgi:hypothetical protein